MSRHQDAREEGHRNWLQLLADCQRGCLRMLTEIELQQVDPTSVVNAAPSHRKLHAHILNYHAMLQPFADQIPEIWEKEYSYMTDRGMKVVTVSTLSEDWRQRRDTTIQVSNNPISGESEEMQAERLWLPIDACQNLYRDFNTALRKLGVGMQVSEMIGFDEPPEPPEHVLENAPAYGGADS